MLLARNQVGTREIAMGISLEITMGISLEITMGISLEITMGISLEITMGSQPGTPGNLLSSRRTNSSRENPRVLAGRIRTARTPEFLQEFTGDEFVPRDSADLTWPADPSTKRRLPQCTESLYYH